MLTIIYAENYKKLNQFNFYNSTYTKKSLALSLESMP